MKLTKETNPLWVRALLLLIQFMMSLFRPERREVSVVKLPRATIIGGTSAAKALLCIQQFMAWEVFSHLTFHFLIAAEEGRAALGVQAVREEEGKHAGVKP